MSPTNLHCPNCGAPIPNTPAEHHVGGIRFDVRECIVAWFADGKHNRRQRTQKVAWDRRTA